MAKLNSRSKGQRGEREVIDLLTQRIHAIFATHGCADKAPLLQRNTLQYDKGGNDICGIEWLAIEVKFQEKNFCEDWWQQCTAQARENQIALLFYRRKHCAWKIRLFVYLWHGDEYQQVPADIDENTFANWFDAQIEAYYFPKK